MKHGVMVPQLRRCMMTASFALLALGGSLSSPALAQDGPRPPATQPPRPAPRMLGRGGAQQKAKRPVVDKLQARVDQVLRNRLSLNDEQFTKLRALNTRLDEEKRSIRTEEAQTRKALRDELLPGATPNEAHVAELLDRLPNIERRRVALQEREQKELAAFMQPAQRARYFALQDEIRRSLQDVQRMRGEPGDSLGRGGQLMGPATRGGPGGRLRPPPPPEQ